jgi:hypothetical protein
MRLAVGLVICAVLLPAALYAQYTQTDIYHIQQDMIPVGTDVEVDSVVVTAIDLKPTTYGFWAQEIPGGPWSGVLCYCSYTDPVATWDVEVGDLVLVQGTRTEYPLTGSQVTEIDVDNVVMIQKDYGEPACQLLSTEDLGWQPIDSTYAERWEGVYICVDTVYVDSLMDFAEWLVGEYHDHPGAVPGMRLSIDDKLVDPTLNQPAVGDTLSLIKGVFSEEYGTYKLWPRGTSDLTFMGPPPGPNLILAYPISETEIIALFDRDLEEASAENINNYYLQSETAVTQATLNLGNPKRVRLLTATQPDTLLDSLVVCDVKSAEGTAMFECESYGFMSGITPIWFAQRPAIGSTYFDDSQLIGQQITVRGVVTSSSAHFGGPFFMRDGLGPWNGMYVYWPGANVTVGDSIVISGSISEYYGWTELGSVDYSLVLDTGIPVAPDVVANTTLMADSMASESYESCFIKLEDMEVVTYLDSYGEWDVDDIGHSANVPVGDFAVTYGEGYAYPGLESIVDIQGCMRYDYNEYKIEPRDSSDIVIVTPCTAGTGSGGAIATRLDQNTPNPFVSGTTIKFAVAAETRVKVAVYDVSGRMVRELANKMMTAGEHTLSWDGKDSNNQQVGPGIYFYEFTTPKGSIQKKMVVLK